jgi:hypothetical protein
MTVLLTQVERRWAHATLDTLFPGPERGALPLGIEEMDVDGFLDETFRQVPFEAALGLRAAIWVIALAPLFVLRRFATIASLPPADRLVVVSTMGTSPVYVLRSLVMMVKAIGALFYCGDARVRPSIVGVVPPVVTVRLRRGARLPSSDPDAPVSSSSSLPSTSHAGADHEPHRRSA